MTHPFSTISFDIFPIVFLPLLTLTIAVGFGLWYSTTTLKPGIVSFELHPLATIKQWNELQKIQASFNTGLDFLFLLAYSNTLALGCIWASRQFSLPWSGTGIWLAWGQWLAAGFDCLEDLALVAILFGFRSGVLDKITPIIAKSKFVLIAVGFLYVCVAGVVHLSRI
jgi:hypothetical protein